MDSPNSPIVNVPLHNSPIPLKQHYSLPSFAIKYMLENSSAINYFNLLQTCKILRKFIQGKYAPQIDVLEVEDSYHDSYFSSIQARNKEITIHGSEDIHKKFPKNQKLWVRKRLLFKRLFIKDTSTYLEKINFSAVKEVYLSRTTISIEDYKKLLVPSIEIMYVDGPGVAEGFVTEQFDIIPYTLKHLPNLKSFKLPWNPALTAFDELTAIKRDKRLQKAEIYFYVADLDKKSLSEFISEQMSPKSTLCLRFECGVPKTFKNRYQKFASEFNKISFAKIYIE
uniref:F-box domain-containing protein n=1 Tax=Panagrolaimus davidi TaxID=227884 RepID=A0A914PH96_9BILA